MESQFNSLSYFWDAAIINEGDIFGYMEYMIEHRPDLEAIGAVGCLAAIDKLMPFFQEQQKLESDSAKMDYWQRTRHERRSAEGLAEDVNDFGRLLLRFAEENASRLGTD